MVGLTGRNDDQKAATLGNLAKVGYTGFTVAELLHQVGRRSAHAAAVVHHLRRARTELHDDRVQVADPQARRATTRATDIVANLGDQFSDLIGGYADRAVKLPNPTYYLP